MACLASEYADFETHKRVTRLQGNLAPERRLESVATTAGWMIVHPALDVQRMHAQYPPICNIYEQRCTDLQTMVIVAYSKH